MQCITFTASFCIIGRIKKNLAALLSEEWYLLPQNHRVYLTTFLIRLNDGGLAANPLNLYTVNPTSLLSLLAMHVVGFS